jgi:hypothetical protein
MIGTSQTRQATLVRIGLTVVVASAAMIVAVAALGAGSPVGFLLAIPPLYLVWVLLVDLRILLKQRMRASASYVRRPYYWAWIAGCLLPLVAWVVWLSSHRSS